MSNESENIIDLAIEEGMRAIKWQFTKTPDLIAELKRCYRVIEDIESMIPDNHEEIDPVLSDILSECHRLLGM